MCWYLRVTLEYWKILSGLFFNLLSFFSNEKLSLLSFFWGEESGTGNEIRGVGCLCVLVPPQSATAFKGPAPVRVQCLGCGHGSRSVYTCPIVQICLQ